MSLFDNQCYTVGLMIKEAFILLTPIILMLAGSLLLE